MTTGADREWPELMTVAEVAAIMRVSKMTVYRLVKDGSIDTTRIGRGYRLHAASVREYIKTGSLGAP
jgi:excisionase family DNA binding protein